MQTAFVIIEKAGNISPEYSFMTPRIFQKMKYPLSRKNSLAIFYVKDKLEILNVLEILGTKQTNKNVNLAKVYFLN